jgi:hypothetical protein
VSDQFYSGPADLAHGMAVIDDWDAYVRSDDRLTSWAHAVVDEPETERDLGQFADWACDITDRREP